MWLQNLYSGSIDNQSCFHLNYFNLDDETKTKAARKGKEKKLENRNGD